MELSERHACVFWGRASLGSALSCRDGWAGMSSEDSGSAFGVVVGVVVGIGGKQQPKRQVDRLVVVVNNHATPHGTWHNNTAKQACMHGASGKHSALSPSGSERSHAELTELYAALTRLYAFRAPPKSHRDDTGPESGVKRNNRL